MLIYANKCKNGASDIFFFSPKDLSNYQKRAVKKSSLVLTRYAKKDIFCPSGPPDALLSVNWQSYGFWQKPLALNNLLYTNSQVV